MMAFQIFPRAGYTVTLMIGALGPVVAFLTYRWYRFGIPVEASGNRFASTAAFLLVAVSPVLFTADMVRSSLLAPAASDLPDTALSSPALVGIHPKPESYEGQHLAAFDALVTRLEAMEPPDAPLFVVHNEPMIYFVSARRPLFADHALLVFLAGWNLLPENDRDTPSSAGMIGRLEAEPETIIVLRLNDRTAANFAKFFPRVARFIAGNYRVVDQIDDYQILRTGRPR
jgi:hypothetical protein